MILFRRSRILNGVRLFLFLLLASILAGAAEPTTTEGRINRNAFPLARYGAKAAPLPKAVERELRARIDQVLGPVRLAPAAWFRATLGSAPSPTNRRKILDGYGDVEIWKCLGESCAGCPGNETSGCVLSAETVGGVGVVALIHPCLYGEGKCPRGASTDVGAWTEKFVVGVAYYKTGLPKDGAAFRKAQKASAEWLASTSRSVNRMLGACPGPYPADSLKFLSGVEAVALPNPAVLRCGRSYLAEIRGLPTKCKLLGGALKGEWAAFEKKQIRPGADVLRCDDYCLKMLCRKKDAGAIFTRFGERPALLLGDGACEGETTKMRGRVLRAAIPPSMRAPLEESGCLPPEEASAGEGSRGPGPDVILVE